MSFLKKILKLILLIAIIFTGCAFMLITYLTISEYKPAKISNLPINNQSNITIDKNSTINISTWNIGYAALSDNADFFMDGGKDVMSSSKSKVSDNLESINFDLKKLNSDIFFCQEVDINSKRSYKINEKNFIANHLNDYSSSFAYNFKVKFIPYPLPPIGRVESGLLTLSKYKMDISKRFSLPNPFKWPVRTANLKRALLVSKLPISGSNKKLVLVNLHLEAYDDGSGKLQQTKALKNLLESEYKKGNYVIAGGDFNQTFENEKNKFPVINKNFWQPGIMDGNSFEPSFKMLMDSHFPSCRSLNEPFKDADKKSFQYYMIDGFLVSKNIDVIKIKTENLNFKNSDHNPVTLSIKLD